MMLAEADAHSYDHGYGNKGYGKAMPKGKGKVGGKGKGKGGDKGKLPSKGKQPRVEVLRVDEGLLKSDEVGAATPTAASPSMVGKGVSLKKLRGEKRTPPLRSIQRLAKCAESGNFEELPQGYAWLAIGLEPSSCMGGGRPHIVEILAEGKQSHAAAEQKPVEKQNAEQSQAAAVQKPVEKLNAEPSQAAAAAAQKPIVEKQNAEPSLAAAAAEQKPIVEKEKQNAEQSQAKAIEDAVTPSKRKMSRLPKVSDFVPQIPGPLGPKVDPNDF